MQIIVLKAVGAQRQIIVIWHVNKTNLTHYEQSCKVDLIIQIL